MRFEDALRLAGLIPRAIEADGRLRRCATKSHPHRRNGWHVLHLDGKRGVYGDNAIAPRQALGHWQDDHAVAHHVPSQSEIERQRKARERNRADRVQAIKSARAFWNNARPLNRPHPYIEAKGLSPLGCAGLRTHDGLLVVPVMLGDWLISVQTITAKGEKRYWPGAPVKSGCHILSRARWALTVFVEGLATGLAVFQSVRTARVVVAFDSGNLLPVVANLKPSGSVCIAADNDHATLVKRGFNPGLDAARNAADLVGCGVAYPRGIEGSDWADFLHEMGEGAGRKLERALLAGAKYVMT